MMAQAFSLAVKELFDFACGGFRVAPANETDTYKNHHATPLALDRGTTVTRLSDTSGTHYSQITPLRTEAEVVHYVVEDGGAPLFASPHREFDGVVTMVPFGARVAAIGFQDQYVAVVYQGSEGFMLKDTLSISRETMWPVWQSGVYYGPDHATTVTVRRLIHDEFKAGLLGLPLQPSEYVTARLLRDNISIGWPPIRPRVVGRWHEILRGVTSVYHRVRPQEDTLIEWLTPDGEGRIGYVELVLPDQTITISGVGIINPHQYNERTVMAQEWREWRPIFMHIYE